MPSRRNILRKLAAVFTVIALTCVFPMGASEVEDDDHRSEPVSTTGTPGIFLDEFDDDGNVTLMGDAVLRDGTLTLDPPVLFEDDFERTELSPWTLEEGTGSIEQGRLELVSDIGGNTTVSRQLDHHDVRLESTINFGAFGSGGCYITLVFLDKSLRFVYDHEEQEMRFEVHEVDGKVLEIDDYSGGLLLTTEYDFKVAIKGDEPRMDLRYYHWPYSFSRTGNVTGIELGCWGGAEMSFDDLVVEDMGATGVALSRAIDLPKECLWDEAYSTDLSRYAEYVGEVAIVDAITGIVIPYMNRVNYWIPFDIQDIHIYDHPSIRLRASFWLDGFSLPLLRNWSVSWKVGGLLWMDSFDNDDNCTLSGRAHIDPRGIAMIDHVIWEDDFSLAHGSPWTTVSSSSDGSVRMEDGCLWIEGPDSPGEVIGVEWEFDLDELDLFFDLFVEATGPGGFELRLSTVSGKAFILKSISDEKLQWFAWDSYEIIPLHNSGSMRPGRWWDNGEIFLDRDGDHEFGGNGMYTGGFHFFGENFTRLRIICGQGFDMRWDNMAMHHDRFSGQVLSEAVTLPAGMVWQKLRLLAGHYIDIIDSTTMKVVPGYGGMTQADFMYNDGAYELDLRGLDPRSHPSIRLRANLLAFTQYASSHVIWWQLWWEEGAVQLMDPFDDADGVTTAGTVVLVDGRVTTPNVLYEDDFVRHDISPWKVESGHADITDRALWTQGVFEETSVELDLPAREAVRLEVSQHTQRWLDNNDEIGPRMELRTSGDERLVFWTTSGAGIEIAHWKGTKESIVARKPYDYERYEWYRMTVGYDGTKAYFEISWEDGKDNVYVDRIDGLVDLTGDIEQLVLHSGRGRFILWDDVRVTTPEETGTAVTDPFSIPEGEGWLWLEVGSNKTENATLTMSLEDADTGETIPGFEDMEGFLFDLSGLDPVTRPDVRLRFEMTGVYHEVPYVDYYRVYWTGMTDMLSQIKEIETIVMTEDSPETNILDLHDYFTSTLTPSEMLDYELIDASDPEHVLVLLDGWMVSIDLPVKNWNGEATFRVRVSNGKMVLTTGPIKVIVEPEDDSPFFDPPERVEVVQGVPYVLDLAPYVIDVDTPLSEITLSTTNANCTVDGFNLTMLFTEGDIETWVRVRLTYPEGNNSTSIDVWVKANPDFPDVDDPPTIAAMSALEFDEDTDFILDLAPYVGDPDTADEDLIVTVDEPNCTVDGLVLTFYFEDVPETLDLEVTVEVSDGSTTVSRMVRMRVWDIPDVPPPPHNVWPSELSDVPIQSFRVNTVKIIDLSPYISDRDTLAEDLTLSSTQAQVIEVLGLKMAVVFDEVPAEDFSIDFTVSDGVHQVHGSFGVLVKEADTDPQDPWYNSNAGLLVVIVIIVVLVVASAYVLLRKE